MEDNDKKKEAEKRELDAGAETSESTPDQLDASVPIDEGASQDVGQPRADEGSTDTEAVSEEPEASTSEAIGLGAVVEESADADGVELPQVIDEMPEDGVDEIMGSETLVLPTIEDTVVQPVAAEFIQGEFANEAYADPAASASTPGPSVGVGSGKKSKNLFSTTAGRIGIAAVAVALLLVTLFTTHVICFHKWSDPTCTAAARCSVCGKVKGEPYGHNWREATCTEPQTCARCGKTEGSALGHSNTKWEVTTEATCTKAGVESSKCDRCGEVQTREVPMVPHEYGEWKTTKEATCTAKGEQKRACKNCGKEDVKALEMIDHELGEWKTTKEATCTEEGERTRECKNCGKKETEPIDKVDHTPGDWVITKQAEPAVGGGSTEGERTRSCTVCGKVLDTETYTLNDEELKSSYIAECESPSFEDVARYPDDWEGKKVRFTGEVIQVLQDGNEYTLRVNVTDNGYFWTDTIMVYYEAPDGGPRILEDDVMTFYGRMSGMYSYESVLGATITVPLMFAMYTE